MKTSNISEAIEPLPCPFCGKDPTINPVLPEQHGNAWGEVRCENKACPARPVVDDGQFVADERGSDEYKKCAILRWNMRGGKND
jgi:hypothetical protein